MLASFIVRLQPVRSCQVGDTLGRSLQGLLLNLLAHADASLADRLHTGSGVRPYTVSTLSGRWATMDGRRLALADELYRVRYTVLTEEVFAALSEVLTGVQAYDAAVPIDGEPFVVADITADPEASDGWAEVSSYEQVFETAACDRRICLRFASPTTFHTGDIHLTFPLPRSVFGSHLRKWEEFSGIELPSGLMELAESGMETGRFRLETRKAKLRRRESLTGFTGICQFDIHSGDSDLIHALNVLGDFALFAGTGRKTTQGLGQTRRVACR